MLLQPVSGAVNPLTTMEDLLEWVCIHSYIWTRLPCIKPFTRKDMLYLKVQDARGDRRFVLGTIDDISINIQRGFYDAEIEEHVMKGAPA